MDKIGIINYGMGNLFSVKNAINFIGKDVEIIDKPSEIQKFDKLILPGVGAFAKAMDNLTMRGFIEPLTKEVLINKKSLLGLCLGMQLLFESSEEHGLNSGLGWIKGKVRSLKNDVSLIVPHMGWNNLKIKKKSYLLKNIDVNELDYYFVHSFYCKCNNENDIIASAEYEVQMDVIIEHDYIFGCQFHPEKSQKNGLELIKNFCEL
jgi:glutamine amidotransferase